MSSVRIDPSFIGFTTADVPEGANLYYLDSRVNSFVTNLLTNTYNIGAAISANAPLAYNSGTGVLSLQKSDATHDGYLAQTDWTTFNAKEPAITVGTTSQYWRGDKTFQTLNTGAVTESTSLYYTDTRVRATVLTGLSTATNVVIIATDTVLSGLGKLQAQISALITGVSSVNGFTGAVSLITTNINEGTNLYWTQARFDTAFSGKSTTNLSEGTNLYWTQSRFDTAFSGKSTTNLTEGTNLYFTNARVQANRLDQMTAPGADVSWNSHKITSLLDPTSAQDAATKNYIDLAVPGISGPIGELTMTGNVTVTTIAVAGTYVKAAGTTAAGTLTNFTHSSNRLTYTGTATRRFRIFITATVELASGGAKIIGLRISKNGATITTSSNRVSIASGFPIPLVCQAIVSLATNDFIEAFVTNESNTVGVIVSELQITAI